MLIISNCINYFEGTHREPVTGHTETVGDHNIHVQDIKQKYGSVQKSK